MSKKISNLQNAKKAKNDEFYTRLEDIEKELKHYREHFKGKVVYCNCDDHRWSNFFKYFELNFDFLGLKKLITTHFEADKPSYKLVMERDINGDGKIDEKDIVETKLKGNGDFRSPEAIELLKEADIVVTNPPFSLFREYIAQLIEYDKKFILLGNNNAITYKEIFTLIKENKIWLGTESNKTMEFRLPDHYEKWNRVDEEGNKYGKVQAISWFTNLEHPKRNEEIFLFKEYNKEDYPKYDNYDAINIDKVKDIPKNYFEPMGVPITFLGSFNPEQFEILDGIGRYSMLTGPTEVTKGTYLTKINGKPKYARIIIKRKEGNK
jgi:hypothetical protein